MNVTPKRFARFLLGLGIMAGGFAVAGLLWVTRPQAEKREETIRLPKVEVAIVTPETVSFSIPSQGIVESDRRTRLASEVAGKVIEVSPKFKGGSRVEKGEWLIRLDSTDFKASLAQAASTLADAKSSLASEEARAAQAVRDWRNMGRGGEPPELVARKPQLESAKARVDSAAAALEKAQADLKRTEITSPYNAVISRTMTELGSYLGPGVEIAEVFATAPYEVRLPVSVDEASFLAKNRSGDWTGEVTLTTEAAGSSQQWTGQLIRTEGEIDRATRSLYLIASIEEESTEADFAVRPGLFLQASIPASPIPDVLAIPFRAFRDLERVVVVDAENRIQFREVTVLHRENETVFAQGNLLDGDRICLTELPDLVEGLEVEATLTSLKSSEDGAPAKSIELTN